MYFLPLDANLEVVSIPSGNPGSLLKDDTPTIMEPREGGYKQLSSAKSSTSSGIYSTTSLSSGIEISNSGIYSTTSLSSGIEISNSSLLSVSESTSSPPMLRSRLGSGERFQTLPFQITKSPNAQDESKSRPKSSQPKLQGRPVSRETIPFQKKRSHYSQDEYNAPLSLKEITVIPGAVRVWSGTYTTKSEQGISRGTMLYLQKKVQRRVVQFNYYYPKITRLVNVSLNYNIYVGFKHSNINFQNVSEVSRQRILPKVLCVVNTCSCNELHCPISESDVLIVLALEKKALVVRNVSTQVTHKLPHKCSASFTTDPTIACVLVKDLEILPQDSLPWTDVVPKERLVHEAPQRDQSTKIEKIFTEDCFKVQVAGSTEMYLLPLDANLEVVSIPSDDYEFPVSQYELMEDDIHVLNQSTIIEYPRNRGLSQYSSEKSSASSGFHSSSSSLSSIPECSLPLEFTRATPQLELNLRNLHFETREVTNVSTFGIYLDIPPYIVESLEKEFPHDLERRQMGLLSYWLRSKGAKASWDEVLKALEMMGENQICERIKWKNCHAEDSEGVQMPPIYYDDVVDKEQEIKENLMKLEGELYDMRKQLKCLENLNMFQKSLSDAQKQELLVMNKRVKIIELNIRAYLLDIELEQLNQSGPPKESADVGLKVPDQIYYNALPLNNHRYISKLWVSEEETLHVELKENEAQQKVLEDGKCWCEKQLAELTTCTASVSSQSDIFERCYYTRLTLNSVIYKHKLAVLKVKEEELKKQIKELQEEKQAELLRFCPKPDPDLLPMQLQRHRDPQIHVYPAKTKALPVLKPRSLLVSSTSPDRKNKTQKDSLKVTQDPPSSEQTGTPTPRPRKRGTIIQSRSQEEENEAGNTHLSTSTKQDHLPTLVSGPHIQRPMTSALPRNLQKPTVPPRRKKNLTSR